VPVPAILRSGPARRHEILVHRAHLPLDLWRDPAYDVDSPLWARWFEAEHDARREMVEAHLEGLDDDDIDYEEAEADLQPPPPPPPAPVNEEEDEDAPRGDDFPM
jgi:hypothetical protein